MNRLRGKLTYANVVATLALFLALAGGTAYAATHLGKNSVGTAQLKKNAVTGAKVKNGSLGAADFAAGQLPAGPTGPRGPEGPAGAEGAPGKDLTTTTTLPPGQTETGTFLVAGGEGGGLVGTTVNFAQPLATPIDAGHMELLEEDEPSLPHCPGPGRADPGYFCAYTDEQDNVHDFSALIDHKGEIPGGLGRGSVGFFFEVESGFEEVFAAGTWAVTAP
jgi:hypothetical protein